MSENLSTQLQGLKIDNFYNERSSAFMAEQKIQVGNPIIENAPARTFHDKAQKLSISTNIFRAKVEKPIPIFQYSVSIHGRNARNRLPHWIDFTDGGSNEFFLMERRNVCAKLFRVIMHENPLFKEQRHAFYYDMRSILFSTKNLNIDSSKPLRLPLGWQDVIRVNSELQTPTDVAIFRNCDVFAITIQKNEHTFSTDLSALRANQNVEEMDREFSMFLDVASSQEIADRRMGEGKDSEPESVLFPGGVSYFMNPDLMDPRIDGENLLLDNGVYIAAGVSKSTRLIGTAGKIVESAVVVEPKLSPLHAVESVARKVLKMWTKSRNPQQVEQLIRGLYIYPVHLYTREDNNRLIITKIVGLGKSSRNETFEYEGEQISVFDYFQRVYKIQLEHPDLPVLKCQQGYERDAENKKTDTKRFVFYPMEQCEILDNQRLSTSAQTGIIEKLIKSAAMPPAMLRDRIQNCARAIHLHDSAYLTEASIQITPQPIELLVPRLDAPSIKFNGKSVFYEDRRNQWPTNGTQYVQSANHVVWAIYVVIRTRLSQPFTMEILKNYGQKLIGEACRRGMKLGMPVDVQIFNDGTKSGCGELGQFEQKIKEAAAHNCRYVMVITYKPDVEIHAALKSLEQKYGVVTQNVTYLNALYAAGITEFRRQILENIVNKMNVKMGGLNYQIEMRGEEKLKTDDLIVGVCLNHVAGGRGNVDGDASAPSVIGYSANDGMNPSAFTGDFVYQAAARGSELSALSRVFETVFDRYKKTHNSKVPQRLIVYRNGVSEGQYSQILRFEIPLIRGIAKRLFNVDIPLTLIICTQMHNVRLLAKNINDSSKALDQNLPSGVVVDHDITHPNIPEFFLMSHRAQQGTAKVPRYAVLCNDCKMNMEQLHTLTFALSYGHQIINMPVSIPTPAYVAEEYAKRGRNLYNSSKLRGAPADELTTQLSYQNLEIRDRRVNA